MVVTVGTATEFPFRRLMRALAPLLAPGGELERATGRPVDVLWQTGCTPVDGLPILTATPFLPAADLTAALAEADIVVSHAGTGSALANLAAGRFAVIVSRLAEFGEAGDDHQRSWPRSWRRAGSRSTATPRRSLWTTCWPPGSTRCVACPDVPPFVLR